MISRSLVFTTVIVFGPVALTAQRSSSPPAKAAPSRLAGAISVAEATELTNGWAQLAEGKAEQAAVRAERVLTANPRSAPGLVLAVEAELSRSGASAALTRYEQWLGQRTLEEPLVVRRMAVAVLREAAHSNQTGAARIEALRALSADGDDSATRPLSEGLKSAGSAETRLLASFGNESAVKLLVAELSKGGGSPTTIEALGASGSKSALPPLIDRLQHPSPEIRGAAVEALGKLGARFDVAARLKPLIKDQTSYVRVKAAAALFALGDMSGLPILQELTTAEAPVSRLMAAQSMASQPGPDWLALLRDLTAATEPEIRVGAARLIAPHDPELARRVLEAAMNDQNPAIRDMATESYIEVAPADLRTLRQLLKSSNPLARVQAAARILALLR
jgi:HEAT repeat protein